MVYEWHRVVVPRVAGGVGLAPSDVEVNLFNGGQEHPHSYVFALWLEGNDEFLQLKLDRRAWQGAPRGLMVSDDYVSCAAFLAAHEHIIRNFGFRIPAPAGVSARTIKAFVTSCVIPLVNHAVFDGRNGLERDAMRRIHFTQAWVFQPDRGNRFHMATSFWAREPGNQGGDHALPPAFAPPPPLQAMEEDLEAEAVVVVTH